MGRSAKRTHRPQRRASRVEKARRTRTTLPSWYYRVRKLRWETSFFDPKDPRDFDEDLSELEEQSQQEGDVEHLEDEVKECECDSDDSECDCQFSDDDESERCCDGCDTDHFLGYYTLKEEREQRKREKLQERKKKDKRMKFEKSKKKKIRAAYKRLRKAGKKNSTTSLRPLLEEEFDLFCSDHVNYFYDSESVWLKRVLFYESEESHYDLDGPDVKELKYGDKSGFLSGWLELDEEVHVEFGPFRRPTHARWKPVKVKSFDRRYELSFQFIGKDYLKLRVSRDMVFSETPGGPPTTAPAFFDFVGIWMDPVKEIARLEKEERSMGVYRPHWW